MQTNLFDSISSARAILENLKLKLSPLLLLPSQSQGPSHCKVSDQMEILWLKSTVDKLCQDNALFYQDLNDILRIFEFLGLKYKQLKDLDQTKIEEKTNQRMKKLKENLFNEQVLVIFIKGIIQRERI